MKTSRTFLLLVMGTCAAAAGDTPVPASLPKERYGAMSVRSPFALATAPAAAPAQGSFAANWFVSGIARLNDEDFVSIKARDLSAQFSLHGSETNPQHGVALASVNWSDVVGKSTVILRKGTETAQLEFNQANLRSPLQVTTAATPTATPAAGTLASQATPPQALEIRRRKVPIPVPR